MKPASEDRPTGVVVGIDGSSGSRAALEWALGTESALGTVYPVAAWHLPWWAMTLAGSAVPIRYLQMETDIETMLDEMTAELRTDRLGERFIAHGGAPSVLLEASEGKALLVVGTRGHGAFLDTLLGSVAIACSLRTTIPMAVVPEDFTRGDGTYVVGLDGSSNSFAALLWTLEHAPSGAEIVALNAWNPIVVGDFDMPEGLHGELAAQSSRLLENEVARACELLPHAAVPKMASECGDPRSALERASHGAEMVVVGARGDGGIAGLVLGSVTTALIHRPACPTIIVPSPSDTGRPGQDPAS